MAEGSDDIQTLVDSMDSIPLLMRRMAEAPASPGRYQALRPNASYGMEDALALNVDRQPIKKEKGAKEKQPTKNEENTNRRMMEQAQKIVEHLRKIQPEGHYALKPERTIHELASAAQESLKKHAHRENGDIERLFWNYDPSKKGSVKYDDLGQVLIAAGSVIDKDESYMLAHHLDTKKTGMLEYGDIVSRLGTASKDKEGKSMARLLMEKQSLADKVRHDKEDEARKLKPGHGGPSASGKKAEKKPRAHECAKSLHSHLLKCKDREAQPKKVKDAAEVEKEKSRKLAASARTKKKATKAQKREAVGLKMLENSLVVQLSGQFAGLRNELKKTDISGSGMVNRSEFNAALRHAGVSVSKKELDMLFTKNARGVSVDSAIGLTNGKAVKIEEFVTKMRQRASAPAFAHLSGLTKQDQAVRREEMRVMKKVLEATGMAKNAVSVFREGQKSNEEWVDPMVLKDVLNKLGSNLDDNEFAVLIDKVDENNDGRIEMREFDEYLHQAVEASTQQELTAKRELLASHGRYSNSFRSDELLHSHLQPCYDRMSDSKDFRNETRRWSKLRAALQDKRVAVLRAFQNSGCGVSHLNAMQVPRATIQDMERELSVDEIGRRLTAAGAPLGKEDVEQLNRKLSLVKKDDKKVSMADFCEVAGIPVSVTSARTLMVNHPTEHAADGGIFNASSKSQISHQTHATTMMLSSVDDYALVKGNRRRKVPQQVQPHTHDTSKFWAMEHGTDETKRVISVPRSAIVWDKPIFTNLGGSGSPEQPSRGRRSGVQSLGESMGQRPRRSTSAPPASGQMPKNRLYGTQAVSTALRWVNDESLANYMGGGKGSGRRSSSQAYTSETSGRVLGGAGEFVKPIASLKKRIVLHARPPPYAVE